MTGFFKANTSNVNLCEKGKNFHIIMLELSVLIHQIGQSYEFIMMLLCTFDNVRLKILSSAHNGATSQVLFIEQ